ncbi:MAG: hypothetical protein RLZZ179_1603 [Verrucomicrobiota bacterium]|jgi:uncharacterized membrane protein YfcA
MGDFSLSQWALLLLAGFCCGMGKAGLSGIGIMTVVLMAQIIPGKASSGTVLPLLIAADLMAAALFRQQILWNQILRLAWPILAGIISGCAILAAMPDSSFKPVIGWMVLGMLSLQIIRQSHPAFSARLPHSTGFLWFAGLLTGISTMIANAAGPVATIYLLLMGLPKKEFIATMAWLFLFVNLIKVPFSWSMGLITGPSLQLNLLLLPTVAAGLFAGRWIVKKLPQDRFQFVVLSLATLAALRLILFP